MKKLILLALIVFSYTTHAQHKNRNVNTEDLKSVKRKMIARQIDGDKTWLKSGMSKDSTGTYLNFEVSSNYSYDIGQKVIINFISGDSIVLENLDSNGVRKLDRMFRSFPYCKLTEDQQEKLTTEGVYFITFGDKEIELIHKNRYKNKAIGYFRYGLNSLD